MEERSEVADIGPYHVIGVLGEGGMGVVYAAEQRRPISRRVALKVIKVGMDTKEVLARFEAERQALALLDHPNIAKVLDAGATLEGRPFFAMELVRGLSITSYCDQGRLSIQKRVEVLLQACAAIQHAHGRGILHRDIKPSNLLVTEIDGEPVVKVIDFGLAKAMNQRLTERTLFTEEGRIIGTPEYMSPEQAETSAQDVDMRSDVFSLGVVLYELIAGALPFDFQAARAKGYFEVQRCIREDEPPTPRQRLTGMRGAVEQVLALRRCRMQDLATSLRNGLDAVTMKAIAKMRHDRYPSCAEFAADLRRFLLGEPVLAAKTGMLRLLRHRGRHLLRRNSALVAALFAIAAIGGTWLVMRPRGRQDEWRVKQFGTLDDGQRVGSMDGYYESGRLRARGQYDADQRTGVWTFYHENGCVELNGAFDRGGRTGDWVIYRSDGNVSARGAFRDDQEDGPWTFFGMDGAIERVGQFDGGRLSGPWRYYGPRGTTKAEGYCHRGRRLGPWRLFDETGKVRMQDFGVQAGTVLLLERWPSGARRRAGVLEEGRPVGRWTTWHEGGEVRFCCARDAAGTFGVFEMRDEAGNLRARGVVEGDRLVEGSSFLRDGHAQPIVPGPLPPGITAWATSDALAKLSAEQAIATLCAEIASPVDPAADESIVGPTSPTAVGSPERSLETAPQSFPTEMQRQEMSDFVRKHVQDSDAPRRAQMQERLRGIGTLKGVDGKPTDLAQFVGKKRVLLVFLRGYMGEICVDCFAQTAVLNQKRLELAALNIEPLVVYPGSEENHRSFEAVYRTTFAETPPPYRVFYDPDGGVARKLGLGTNPAFPSFMLIDEPGIVQEVYVGENRSDRLTAKSLLRLIDDLAR